MANTSRVAKEAGVERVVCPRCGSRFRTDELLDRFFKGLIELLRRGEEVRIKGFGVFGARIWKGRTLKTPLIPGGGCKFPDTWVVRFRLSLAARNEINRERR